MNDKISLLWEKPIDINDTEVLKFPKGIFPDWLEQFVEAVAEETQTPFDAPAIASLSILSTIFARKFKTKVRGSWYETANIYAVLALDSGNRKSAVFKKFISPIMKFEKNEAKRLELPIKEQNEWINAKDKRITALRTEYAKENKPQILNQINEVVEEVHKIKKLRVPKHITSDATPERLVTLMAEHNQRIAILSAEGAEAFQMMAGRYGDPNLDVYLKAYSSDPIDTERMSREFVRLDDPTMTIGLFVQTSVIRNLPRDFSNRGLTQRFIYSFPKSFIGNRKIVSDEIDNSLIETYETNIGHALKYKPETTLVLSLSNNALKLEENLRSKIENELQSNVYGEDFRGWLSKLAGQIIRITSLVHLSENILLLNKEMPLIIKSETFKNVERLTNYLISHAKVAYSIMGVDESKADLNYLLDAIKERKTKENNGKIPYREIQNSTRRRFKRADDLKRKLNELEKYYVIKLFQDDRLYVILNPYLT